MTNPSRLILAAAVGLGAASASLPAQGTYDQNKERYEEIRESTLPAARDVIIVDGRMNGGVKVEGWDRDEILVRAKIQIHNRSEEEARELAGKIQIESGDSIHAEGPGHDWAVSFEIRAPYKSNLQLTAHNGGIHIANIQGDLEFETQNGGIHLAGVGGDVTGHTTNGGLHVDLEGDHWEGEKLDVSTTNGGVRLRIPGDYSARLETSTVNGGVNIDFPVTVKGRVGRAISTVLGEGGATLRLKTTNGGLDIRRS